MSVFLDTSAIIALVDGNETNHPVAQKIWLQLLLDEVSVVTTSYVLTESYALLQRRFGIKAVQDMHQTIAPYPFIVWVEDNLHQEGITLVLTANRKALSLVDCISFAVMRRLSITSAFAFDNHFTEQGFVLLS